MDATTPSSGVIPPGPLVQIRSYARRAGVEDHTTTRVALRPIAGWRMDYGRFEFDSSFVEPEAALEIPRLTDLTRQFPESPISIFGHADPTGDDDYNKPLSGRRALAVYALLVRDVELWDELYEQELPGDRWGLRSVQRMLAQLRDADGEPYYQGAVDDWFGEASMEALKRFQADNGLEVDGVPGPLSRKAMYGLYMDALCTHPDGTILVLTDDDFLARGEDPEHRGDVQGCSEFNPAMVFATDEHQTFEASADKEERNRENAVNRRVTIFFYPEGVVVDTAKWPCPAARTGTAACRKRFWSDANNRRSPQESRRHFDGDFDTFGCRFYHYIGFNSPAETPLHLRNAFDVYLYHEAGSNTAEGTFTVVSDDGEIEKSAPASDAIVMRSDADGEVRCLRLIGLHAGKRYTLVFQTADGDEEPVVLVEDFTIEEYMAKGAGSPEDGAEVAYVTMDDETFLVYEPTHADHPIDWSKGKDPDDWIVEATDVEDEDLRVTLITITEDDGAARS